MATQQSTTRIHREIIELHGVPIFILDKPSGDDPISNIILGRILPQSNIYNQGAFQIELKLPTEYPFKPPEVRFVTLIYHPNVDEQGKICVDIINGSDAYKPTTRLKEIVIAVVNLIDNPKIEHALNAEIAAEYIEHRSTFDKKALEMVIKHRLPRQ